MATDSSDAPFPFSIVIPVYNRAATIVETLQPFLGVDCAGLEVLVVDDGSTDDTPLHVEAVAAKSSGANIRLVRQANAGPGAARNHGVAEATGQWVAFLDSDDFWFPWTAAVLRDSLRKQGEPEKQSEPAAIFLQTRVFRAAADVGDVSLAATDVIRHPSLYDMRLNAPLAMIGACNMVVRKAAFQSVGGFEPTLRCGEDTDLFYRMGDLGECWSIVSPALLAYRANSPDSLSKESQAIRKSAAYLLNGYRDGRYPGPVEKRDAALLKTLRLTVGNFFALGEIGAAYATIWAGLPLLLANRDWHNLVRLPLTPLLSILRPANYRFRLKS